MERESFECKYKQRLTRAYTINLQKLNCQPYTKYRPNETTGGIFVSWQRKEEPPHRGLM